MDLKTFFSFFLEKTGSVGGWVGLGVGGGGASKLNRIGSGDWEHFSFLFSGRDLKSRLEVERERERKREDSIG